MAQIELFTAVLCPFALRVRLALAEKDVRVTEVEINPQDRPAWFVEMSPTGKVPVLRHAKKLMWDSAVICEYLEEAFPDSHLLPEDPYDRARARMWIKFADTRLFARTEALLHSFDRKLHAAIITDLAESLIVLEREALKGGSEGRRLMAWWEAVAARDAVRKIGKPPAFYLEAYGRLIAA